jgi:excisionase family DNA binding protein
MSHNVAAYEGERTLPRVLTVNDTAAVLGISRATVYRLVQSGDLRPVRVGRRLRFRLADLEDYLKRESGPGEAARQGRSDTDHLALIVSVAAVLPDPRAFRHEIPGPLWRAWEFGEIDRAEFWDRLVRLRGTAKVDRLVTRGRAA